MSNIAQCLESRFGSIVRSHQISLICYLVNIERSLPDNLLQIMQSRLFIVPWVCSGMQPAIDKDPFCDDAKHYREVVIESWHFLKSRLSVIHEVVPTNWQELPP
jgi:hypothetical protein